MKTEELIRALVSDCTIRPVALRQAFALAVIPAVAITLCLYFVVLGPRPHLIALLATEPRLLFKISLAFLLVLLSALWVLRLARPGIDPRRAALALCIIPVLLATAIALEFHTVPASLWTQKAIGTNAVHCLKSITFLGFAPLIAILLWLRYGAPRDPVVAGAAGGLLAGAIGAFLYATHCPDDSPFFVALWYTLAITFLTALGAVVGSRLLRW